ncbi:MAG TPA: hypothetical protein VFX70_06750 [Mycobacteriales bacterium]|nr:hypothetical protein [Mycobacteriales bacterium]
MTAEPIRIPVEVTAAPPIFDLVSRGYDRVQVDEHLLAVEQELAEVCWQRDWLESQEKEVTRERERLTAERADWEAERDAWQAEKDAWEPSPAKIGDRAHAILRMAHEEAEQLLEATRRACADRRARDEAEASAARESLERELAEARAGLRGELDLMRLQTEAEVHELVHQARQQAARIAEAARHETETMRLRALEYLGAARQERAKAASLLGDLADRLHTVSERLAGNDDFLARRLVVLTGQSDEPGQLGAAPPA